MNTVILRIKGAGQQDIEIPVTCTLEILTNDVVSMEIKHPVNHKYTIMEFRFAGLMDVEESK